MNDPNIPTIGKLIEQKRRIKRIMQEELAFNCNITRKTMSNIETSKNLPSLPLFVKIAHELDMSGHELLKEIEERGLLEEHLSRNENKHEKKS